MDTTRMVSSDPWQEIQTDKCNWSQFCQKTLQRLSLFNYSQSELQKINQKCEHSDVSQELNSLYFHLLLCITILELKCLSIAPLSADHPCCYAISGISLQFLNFLLRNKNLYSDLSWKQKIYKLQQLWAQDRSKLFTKINRELLSLSVHLWVYSLSSWLCMPTQTRGVSLCAAVIFLWLQYQPEWELPLTSIRQLT